MNNLRVLIDQDAISTRIKELGKIITADYTDKNLVVICMLKGASIFFADLIREIKLPLTIDFAKLSSYGCNTSSEKITLVCDLTTDVAGKDLLIVEDVIDSGKTLKYYTQILKKKQPNSIKICTFLDKPNNRQTVLNADYVGFSRNCGFVVGYGLDYAEKYRELPYLAEICIQD